MTRRIEVPCSGYDCPNTIQPGKKYCVECQRAKWRKNAKIVKEDQKEEQAFYNSPTWKKMRVAILKSEPGCRVCTVEGRFGLAHAVDHIVPLRIAWGRRLDPTNLQPICNTCHAKKRVREMRMDLYSGDDTVAMITVVCGAPGSGKTHYVRENFVRGDLIIDLDYIYSAMSMLPLYDKPGNLLPYALEVKTALINKVMLARSNAPRTWLITMAPTALERARLRSQLNATTVVLETPRDVCISRIEKDSRRPDGWAGEMRIVIEDWWFNYSRDDRDVIIKGE